MKKVKDKRRQRMKEGYPHPSARVAYRWRKSEEGRGGRKAGTRPGRGVILGCGGIGTIYCRR